MISSLFFIPLPPSNLRPFGAPPSIGRRECPREPLPLEGAAERSEAGLASFFGGEAASSLPSPLGKGDRAAVDRVLSQTAYLRRFLFHLYHLLETIFFALFHPASTLSSSLCSPPSPRGEGFVRRYSFSTYACICSDNARKAASSFRSLPHWGRGTASAALGCSRIMAHLRQSPLSFIPPEPYPARFARHLPHAGKALSVVILFPHMRVFALTMRG